MQRLWTCLWIGLGLTGCADYGLAESDMADWGTQMDASDYRRLRIDITLRMPPTISFRSPFGLMRKLIGKI